MYRKKPPVAEARGTRAPWFVDRGAGTCPLYFGTQNEKQRKRTFFGARARASAELSSTSARNAPAPPVMFCVACVDLRGALKLSCPYCSGSTVVLVTQARERQLDEQLVQGALEEDVASPPRPALEYRDELDEQLEESAREEEWERESSSVAMAIRDVVLQHQYAQAEQFALQHALEEEMLQAMSNHWSVFGWLHQGRYPQVPCDDLCCTACPSQGAAADAAWAAEEAAVAQTAGPASSD